MFFLIHQNNSHLLLLVIFSFYLKNNLARKRCVEGRNKSSPCSRYHLNKVSEMSESLTLMQSCHRPESRLIRDLFELKNKEFGD